MKLNEIKSIDINGDLLEDFWPDNEDCFSEWFTLSLGVKGQEGAVNYNLLICTPSWLSNTLAGNSVEWGRHMLVIKKFNPDLIKLEINNKIESLLDQFQNDTDVQFSEKIARYAHWEFEDYQNQ